MVELRGEHELVPAAVLRVLDAFVASSGAWIRCGGIREKTDVVGPPDAQFALVVEGGRDAAPGGDFNRAEGLVCKAAYANRCVQRD